MPVNIRLHPCIGPERARPAPASAATSAPSTPSKNFTPPSPSAVGATITCTRSITPACQAAACIAAPPSSSSVEMSHRSSAPKVVPQVAGSGDERRARCLERVGAIRAAGAVACRRSQYYDRPGAERREQPGGRGRPQPPIEDHAGQRAAADSSRARSAPDRRRAACPSRRRWHRPTRAAAASAGSPAREVNGVRTPGAAAIRESRLVAALAITIGRPAVCTITNARLSRAASSLQQADLDLQRRARAVRRSPCRSPADSDRASPPRRGRCRRR